MDVGLMKQLLPTNRRRGELAAEADAERRAS